MAFKNTNVPKFPLVRQQSFMIQPAREKALSDDTEVASIEK